MEPNNAPIKPLPCDQAKAEFLPLAAPAGCAAKTESADAFSAGSRVLEKRLSREHGRQMITQLRNLMMRQRGAS